MAHEKLHALVREDIGDGRAGGTSDEHGAAWVCKPYVRLFRSCGEQWPLEALRIYLQFMGERESVAGEVWERAVARYEAITRPTR